MLGWTSMLTGKKLEMMRPNWHWRHLPLSWPTWCWISNGITISHSWSPFDAQCDVNFQLDALITWTCVAWFIEAGVTAVSKLVNPWQKKKKLDEGPSRDWWGNQLILKHEDNLLDLEVLLPATSTRQSDSLLESQRELIICLYRVTPILWRHYETTYKNLCHTKLCFKNLASSPFCPFNYWRAIIHQGWYRNGNICGWHSGKIWRVTELT